MSNPVRVVAAVIRHNDRVLACRRKNEKASGGKWEFPGGKIEPGETDREALARELAEELDLVSISIGELVSRSTASNLVPAIDLACYWVDTPIPPATSTDHDALRWCTILELQHLDWAEADRDTVALLQRQPGEDGTSSLTVES